MNSRTIILALAVGLLGIGLVMTIAGLFDEETVEQTVTPARAARAIDPYTIITQDMLRYGDPLRARDARDEAAYPFDAVVGKMTTERLKPGDLMTAVNALPPEQVRFTEDLGLEIVTFAAGTEALVGGKVRPGHIINLYGSASCPRNNTQTGVQIRIPPYCLGKEGENVTILIEPRLWVVGVGAGGGPVSNATPEVNLSSGEVSYGADSRERSASTITVAVPPDQAFRIIDSLQAQGLQPYVTLAANQTVDAGMLSTPAFASPTPGLPPDLAATATALFLQMQATPPPQPPTTGGGGSGIGR